jgi:hypothetical protein
MCCDGKYQEFFVVGSTTLWVENDSKIRLRLRNNFLYTHTFHWFNTIASSTGGHNHWNKE